MAENGRRDVVQDPLNLNVGAQRPVRDVATMGVRNPGQSGGADEFYKRDLGVLDAFAGLTTAMADAAAVKEDDWRAEGKLQFMQGATEEQIAASGNKYTMQGWQALNAVDKANRWFADEANMIGNGGRTMDPNEYNKRLMEQRAAFMSDLPEDPAIRKLYVAAFEDMGPRLAAEQTAQHNEWNREQQNINLGNALLSGSATAWDAPVANPGAPLALSPGVVRTTVSGYTDDDVDLLTRVMLGEAGGEGPTGMAAVAHVILNRAIDGGYGGQSLNGVMMNPGAFSPLNSVTGHAGGEQGQNMGQWDPSGSAYQRARSIALDVLSGKHVDPTGGRTHFWSGKDVPYWYASESAKGGDLVIGGHTFVGQGRNQGVGNSPTTGALDWSALPAGSEDIDPSFANLLSNSAVQLGTNFKMASGYRDPSHPIEAAKATPGEHSHKNAVDISLAGKTDEEKAAIVQTLLANGAMRVGVYSSHEGLHVDMKPDQGQGWFMYNGTGQGNALDNAPQWFKDVKANANQPQPGLNIAADNSSDANAVANAAGAPTANTVSPAQTQMAQMLRSSPGTNEDKASVLAESMKTQLGMGDLTLWEQMGGVSMLLELGAPASAIAGVRAAHATATKEQRNAFNMEQTIAEQSLADEVYAGLPKEEALERIQGWYDSGSLSGEATTTAQRLTGEVLEAERKRGMLSEFDEDFQADLSELYMSIGGGADPVAVAENVRILAERQGLEPDQVTGLLRTVWTKAQTHKESLRTEVEKAAAQQVKDDRLMKEVDDAIAQGYGLSELTGRIGREGDTTTQQEYALERLRAAAAENVQKNISQYMEGGNDIFTAQAMAANVEAKEYHRKLQAQGIIDPKFQTAWTAAGVMPVLPDGKPNPETVEALEGYMLIKDRGEYASQYFTDPEARQFFTLAGQMLDGGNTDIERAVLGANLRLYGNSSGEKPVTLSDSTLQSNMVKYTKENFSKWLGGKGLNAGDMQFAMNNMEQFSQLVSSAANRILAEPGQGKQIPSVIAQNATEDVLRDTYLVGGNFIYNNTKNGQDSLATRMGIASGDKSAPNDAVTMLLNEQMNEITRIWTAAPDSDLLSADERLQAEAFSKLPRTNVLFDGTSSYIEPDRYVDGMYKPGGLRMGTADLPFYSVYNSDTNEFLVYLWADETRTKYVDAAPIIIDAEAAGAHYNENKAFKSNPVEDWMNDIVDMVQNKDNVSNAGAAFGAGIIKP